MDIINACLLHLIVLLCLPTISTALIKHDIKTDEAALLALKSHVFEHPANLWTKNWNTTIPVCKWIGIKCSLRHQRVVALNLSNAGLLGSIPPEIRNLSFLKSFDIRNNNFSGSLPQEMAQWRRLKYINLSNNKFSGEFPSWFGSLPNLQCIYMDNNSFTGTLPLPLFNASKLEFMSIVFNDLQGNIPQEIGNLGSLKFLNLRGNGLTGSIPQSIMNISSLEVISLSGNSLTGDLPMNMCSKLRKLQEVRLALNDLSGEIHSKFENCSELQMLVLTSNQFSGSVPRELGNLTMLNTISLAINHFEGPVPVEIGNLQKLTQLKMGINRLSGSIPISIFNISSLNSIEFTMDGLSGILPTSIGQTLPNLESLYLDGNKLSGFIPDSISNLTKLKDLVLSANLFSGSIPTSLGSLRFLHLVHLHENNLTSDNSLSFLVSLTNCRSLEGLIVAKNPLKGILPKAIGNFSSSLHQFYADFCGIDGTIPNEIGNLSGLVILGLSGNYLHGSTPTTLRELMNIQAAYLGINKLSGSIPNCFCSFKKLTWLDLSENQLWGELPECFQNSTSLRNLYLNSNKLNSTIPASLGSLKDLLYLDIHSNTLSGNIPPELGNLKAALFIDLSDNKLSGNIPTTLGDLHSLINLSLAHNVLQGPIPVTFSNLLSIEILDLSVNNITGEIPATFGKLVSLQILDLSHNNLIGEIPASLGSLSNLTHFIVSFNHLRGEIPTNGSFWNFTYESFMSNEALCGGAPQLKFPPCPVHSPRGSRTKRLRIVAYVLIPNALTIFVVSILLAFLINRRKHRSHAQSDLIPSIMHERVSFYEVLQATNGFSESNLLGEGSYGSVYKGVLKDGVILAIKVFNLQQEGALRSFDTECEVLRNLRHRNLVKVISSCSNLEFKSLILEYMPNGSLEKWLYSHNNFLDFLQRLDVMIDVASALAYLHHGYSSPVVHCDLKPSNVLLDEDMTGRVSDFGISKLFCGDENMVHTKTLATIGYIAPEYGSEGIVSTGCDVFSFGILLMETFSRKKPTDEKFVEGWGLKDWIMVSLQNSATNFIDQNLIPSEDENSTKKVQCIFSIMRLALKCTVESPEQRIDTKDALEELRKTKVVFLSV